MSKKAPSIWQLITIALFALSCFGILLFLWVSFGGPTPLRAQGYVVKVPFDEATQLASQSDVRISGVSVGKVAGVDLGPDGELAQATIDIDDKYAPIPTGSRAILRAKTLLGETYVELTPGDSAGPMLEDGSTLPRAQVTDPVQLDEILRVFGPRTRAAFQIWMRESATSIQGRGQDFSFALGELQPAFSEFDRLFRVLDTQQNAVSRLFSNGSTALRALAGRRNELDDLIRNANAVFRTTAERDRAIEETFVAFPTFLDESRATLARLREFSQETDPLVRQLIPAAEELSPTLIAFGKLAPQMRGFFVGLAPVIAAAPEAFPAFRKLLRDEFPPLLRAVQPFLRSLEPIVDGFDYYKHEFTSLIGNATAATNAVRPGEPQRYVRSLTPLGPGALATFPDRLAMGRNNAYGKQLIYRNLAKGLPSFQTYQCSSGLTAELDPSTPEDPDFRVRVEDEDDPEEEAQDFFDRIEQYAFRDQSSTGSVPTPECKKQGKFEPLGNDGEATDYLQTLLAP